MPPRIQTSLTHVTRDRFRVGRSGRVESNLPIGRFPTSEEERTRYLSSASQDSRPTKACHRPIAAHSPDLPRSHDGYDTSPAIGGTDIQPVVGRSRSSGTSSSFSILWIGSFPPPRGYHDARHRSVTAARDRKGTRPVGNFALVPLPEDTGGTPGSWRNQRRTDRRRWYRVPHARSPSGSISAGESSEHW